MPYPTLPAFPHTDAPGGARLYQITADTRLFVLWYPGPLPGAKRGAFVYAFVQEHRVGSWDWCRDATGLDAIMEAYRETTDPAYQPPEQRAPGGERPMIRPPIRDALARAMDAARPGARPRPDGVIALSFEVESE